nr:hypothetical protein [Tanacetum cinerariifolium]
MLTAFFELNNTDPNIRQYLYRDIPSYYPWNKSTRVWKRRKQGKMRGRMVSVNPAEGERFYLRVLLQHVKGPIGFDYLYMVDDVLYTMFRRAALERGLIKSDNYIHALHEECSIVVQDGDILAWHSLNTDQKNTHDTIMRHVDVDSPGVFFIDGPGGTRKTFLYKALLANVRSRGLIALATALSGVAANNMTEGRTTHSLFKIPINLTTSSMCNIKKQSGLDKLLCQAKLIIWDEASTAKRQFVEAVDRTMQDATGVKLPFGGKIMVLGGDFRQVLPVIRGGTRAQIVDSSLRMSPLWSIIKRMRVTINIRA